MSAALLASLISERNVRIGMHAQVQTALMPRDVCCRRRRHSIVRLAIAIPEFLFSEATTFKSSRGAASLHGTPKEDPGQELL